MDTDNPLVEVFGYAIDDFSEEAVHHRKEKLCPFNNKSQYCTKDKKSDPLGACNVHQRGNAVITCPQRFTEDWTIVRDSAEFFFERGSTYRVLREYQMRDAENEVVGNIDFVLVKVENGSIVDFATIEVQSVYISGNMRRPFEHYMDDPEKASRDWRSRVSERGGYYPTPDWRSSHKRLFRQINSKGTLLAELGKKQAVVIQQPFYDSMPDLTRVPTNEANMVWLIYDLVREDERHRLVKVDTIHTRVEHTLTDLQYFETPEDDSDIRAALQRKLARDDSPIFTL